MRYSLLLLIIPLFPNAQVPENLLLKYTSSYAMLSSDNTGKTITSGNLYFDCYFYKRSTEYLFYKTPQFLNHSEQLDFLKKAELLGNNFSFSRDSIQGLNYRNADSMYNLYWHKTSNGYQVNKFSFYKGEQKWEVLPETKKIDRYNCQKAILKDDGDIVWEIWFAPEIPLEFGLANLYELPGLIVEAKLFYPLMEFKLLEYQANIEISKETIKPALLNPPYKELTRESYENSKLRMRKLRKTNGIIQ